MKSSSLKKLPFIPKFRSSFLLKLTALFSLFVFPTTWGPWGVLTAQAQNQTDVKLLLNGLGESVDASLVMLQQKNLLTVERLASEIPNPDDLAEWIRAEIAWVPYAGLLKGSQGTLVSRRANDLERTLLMAAVLVKNGYEVKVHRSKLDGNASATSKDRLLASFKALKTGSGHSENTLASVYDLEKLSQQIASATDRSADEVKTGFEANDAALEMFLKEVDSLTETYSKTLSEKMTSSFAEAQISEFWEQEVEHHCWLEYAADGSSWKSLSLVFDSEVLEQLKTLPRETYAKIADIPDTLKHKVVVRVIADKYDDGTIEGQVALEKEFYSYAVANQQVELSLIPGNALDEREAFEMGMEDPEGFLVAAEQSLLNETKWTPMLKVFGEDPYAEKQMHADGRLSNPGEDPIGTGAAMKRALDLFGSMGSETGAAGSYLSGVRYEFEIHTPGQTVKRETRELFRLNPETDLSDGELTLEFTRQRAMALTQTRMMLFQVGQISRAWAEYGVNRSTQKTNLSFQYILRSMERNGGTLDAAMVSKVMSKMEQYQASLDMLACSRLKDSLVYLSTPNIVCFVSQDVLDEDAGLQSIVAYDWIANKVTALSADAELNREKVLESGVRDTVLENLVLEKSTTVFASSGPSELITNVPGNWVALENASGIKDMEVLGSIDSDLNNGYQVLGDKSKEFSRWWRVDTTTGETLGMGKTALGVGGSPATEYMHLVTSIVLKITAVIGFIKCVDGAKKAGTSGLGCTVCLLIGMAAGNIALLGLEGAAASAVGLGGALGGLGCGLI